MKRTLQLIVSIVIVMGVGCKRESNSARETDGVSQKPRAEEEKKTSPDAVSQVAFSTEWDRSRAIQARQYEKMKALAKDVSKVCAGTNGEEAVDALLAKVSDLIDEYERDIEDKGNAMGYLTTFTWPFAREIESYWGKRWFELRGNLPEYMLKEINLFYRLNIKTVDLLQKKVGNSRITSNLELGACASLKWLADNFEYAHWPEQKKYVDVMVEKWLETRYDVMEGNPLKDACEHTEFYASRDPHREKRHVAVYSRTKNMHVEKALHVVGRLPKWFAAWAEEMERQDNSKSK